MQNNYNILILIKVLQRISNFQEAFVTYIELELR